MKYFAIETGGIELPWDSEAESTCLLNVNWKGRTVTGLRQAAYRSYVYPVLTPSGAAVTTDTPSDHPWHQSISVGSDYFFTYRQTPLGKIEDAACNFYWDCKFQGRESGRIVTVAVNECTELSENHLQITQRLQWQGPEEWSAPPHRPIVAEEMRTVDIYPGDIANIIDIRSRLRPTHWDIRIGPCRHAYFTIRVADYLRATERNRRKLSGIVLDSEGRLGADEICWQLADWIDFSGKDASGRSAGIALFQFPSLGSVPWYVVDYGSIRINPFRLQARNLKRGDEIDLAVRIVAHDGDVTEANVSGLYKTFKQQI